MPKIKLTKRALDAVKLPSGGRSEESYSDTQVSGFALRVRASGAKAYQFVYKRHGDKRRVPLGDYHAVTVEQARKKAQALAAEVAAGGDPAGDRKRAMQAPTVKELAEYFFTHETAKLAPETVARYRRQADRFVLPKLGRMKVEEVRPRDVKALMRSLADTPIQANRVLAFTKRLFSVAVHEEVADRNPCLGVRQNAEEKRRVYLSTDELARLRVVLESETNQDAADYVRLLLMTGARSREVRRARWNALDLKHGKWTKLSSETKTRTTEDVVLNDAAVAVFASIGARRGNADEFVFESPTKPGQPRADFKKPWDRIRKAAGIEHVRSHDLRHTFASYAVSRGATLAEIGALLGHKQAQTTMRYAHLMDDPLREASARVGAVMSGEDQAKDSPNVVAFEATKDKAANDE